MKLYTHEDVLAMMNTFHTSIINRDFCMAKLTPIEINEENTFTYSQTEKCPNCLEQTPLHSLCLDCIVDIGKSAQINIEISDEEILKAAKEYVYEDLDISVGSFELGARWYREQLKNK